MMLDEANPVATLTQLFAIRQLASLTFFELLFVLFFPVLKKLATAGYEYLNTHDFFLGLLKKKQPIHNIIAKVTLENNVLYLKEIPHVFTCVMADMYKRVVANPKMVSKCVINEIPLYSEKSFKVIVFHDQKTEVYVRDKIKIVHNHSEREANNDKKDFIYHTYTLQLIPTDNDFGAIQKYIEECVLNYEDNRLDYLKSQQIFVFSHFTKRDNCYPIYNEIPFNSTKSFDNLFFHQKKDLIHKIDYFNHEIDQYKKTGMPHTLGMLFHGEPGTGKTSAIKAIAKYTKRHLVIIPLKKIKSIEMLRKIMLTPQINDVKIPNSNRLYVFEEIDCGQWADIIKNRSVDTSGTSSPKPEPSLEKMLSTALKQSTRKDDDDDDASRSDADKPPEEEELSLGSFLELLDGIIEMPGRLIILTTNNVDLIDPALTRPGRVDMIVKFTKLSRDMINSYYRLWFNTNIPSEVLMGIPDDHFTQAEIGNLFSGCMDKEKLLEKLITLSLPVVQVQA